MRYKDWRVVDAIAIGGGMSRRFFACFDEADGHSIVITTEQTPDALF